MGFRVSGFKVQAKPSSKRGEGGRGRGGGGGGQREGGGGEGGGGASTASGPIVIAHERYPFRAKKGLNNWLGFGGGLPTYTPSARGLGGLWGYSTVPVNTALGLTRYLEAAGQHVEAEQP